MAMEGAILEGFICPECKADCSSAIELTKHFEESHDPEKLKSIKDVFIYLTKKKILKQDESLNNYSNATVPSSNRRNSDDIYDQYQEIGATHSHTEYFKRIRDTRLERYSSETNKLLIRLDKLLNNLPSDPVERKAHEQTIVPWMDERDVKLCPSCAKSFHIARRKHHCRLCGAVMCQSCTMTLTLSEARKMTSPALIHDDSALSPTQESPMPYSGRLIQAGIGITKLVRSPSSGSLNSVMSLISDANNSEQHFKLCQHCKNLLDARERLKARHFDKPIVHEVYEKMRAQIDEANRYIQMYNKMWQSLSEGETTYDLRDAQLLRVKIAKIGDNIDTISKRIVSLSPPDDEAAQKPETRLYNMVRAMTKLFLKEQLSCIPPVPSEEKFEELQQQRQERIKQRIAQIKQREIDEQKERLKLMQRSDDRNQQSSSTSNQIILGPSEGWGPSNPNRLQFTEDPIVEQMSNLQAYIKQAKDDLKFDEAAILEQNLKELKDAYYSKKYQFNNE